jgi:hypothetical protein
MKNLPTNLVETPTILQSFGAIRKPTLAAFVAEKAMTLLAAGCSEDGTVYCKDSLSALCQETQSTGQDAASSSADVAGSTDVTDTTDAAAADLMAAADVAGSTDAADTLDTSDADTSADSSSSDLLDAATVSGFDAADVDSSDGSDSLDTSAADSSDTAPLPPPEKFWNAHPDAPKDEKITGCDNPELPTAQKVVPSGSYQIAKIEPGKELKDMAGSSGDLVLNNNGEQLYNIPPSQFPINADGKAYRIVAVQMNDKEALLGTYVLSKDKKTGAQDRMPLFGVRSKVEMHAFDIAKAVQGALAPDKFATLSDVRDAAQEKLDKSKYDVRPIVAGTLGKSDGTKFQGGEKGIVWVMPSANAQCTEVK